MTFRRTTIASTAIGLCKAIDLLSYGAALIARWLVLAACLICAANATSRYLFNFSSNGWLEIQWYMFAGIVLLGAPQTLRVNGHVRVDLLYSRLSERSRIWVDAAGICLFLLPTTAYLAYLAWPFFWTSFASLERSSNAGGLLLWPAKAALPLGFALVLLQGFAELLKRALAAAGILAIDTSYEAPLQ